MHRAPSFRAACVLAALAFVVPVVLTDEVRESPVVAIERAVWEAIDRNGSAELVLETGQTAIVEDDPQARALARALFEQARGQRAAAERAVLAALAAPADDRDPAHRAALSGALMLTLIDVGPSVEARRLVAASDDPVLELGNAELLSREGRCVEALAIVERVRAKVEPVAEPIVLAAEALARCQERGAALSWLLGLARGERGAETQPRVMFGAGRLLFEIGDFGSARHWCAQAALRAGHHAAFRHDAQLCASAAAALEGELPRARQVFLETRLAGFRDPSRPMEVRANWGLGAAWVALMSPDPSLARQGLQMLDELSVLPLTEVQAQSAAALRALGYARIERFDDARRALAAVRADARVDPRLPALRTLIEALVAQRAGDASTARTALQRAVVLATEGGAPELAAAAMLADADLAMRSALPSVVVERAIEAVRRFPSASMLGASPFVDPALPRRAVELALAANTHERVVDAAPGERVLLADRLRRALDGLEEERLAFDDVTRQLANRDAALSMLLIGETRSYGFLVESSGLREADLPPGDALFDQLAPFLHEDAQGFAAPSVWAGQLAANLLGVTGSEATGLVVPDGFLHAVPWISLVATPRGLGAEPGSEPRVPPSVLPTLSALLRPPSAPLPPGEITAPIVALAIGDGAGAMPGTTRGVSRLGEFHPVDVSNSREALVVAELGRGADVVHMALPLSAVGPLPREVEVPLRQGGSLARDPESMSLDIIVDAARAPTMLTIVPTSGWARVPGSAVRAAGRAVEAGCDAVIVAIVPPGAPGEVIWNTIYSELGRGSTAADAVKAALSAVPESSYAFIQLAGDGTTRLRTPKSVDWPFWLALVAASAVIAVVAYRTMRARRDPFDIEPPEEPL